MHAYVLMPNHFHLLIQTPKANCAEFMRHFNICYTGWFNWRYGRCGNLYQGRYKAFLIDVDSYFLEVSRYLHLNPARTQKITTENYQKQWIFTRDYHWSSLKGYLDEKKKERFVEHSILLSMIKDRRQYAEFIADGLKRDIENPFKNAHGGLILGDEDFVTRVKQFVEHESLREQPAYRELHLASLEPLQVIDIIKHECGINEDILHARHRHGALRGMVAELLYRHCSITQSQIGELLGGIDYISVHMMRKRLQVKLAKEKKLKEQFIKLEAKIKANLKNV